MPKTLSTIFPGVLPDLLTDDLKLVFCGTAPSRRSAQDKAYYAHPGNLFWPTLFAAGFLPQRLQAAEYPLLLKYAIGLTDLNKQQSGVDATLDKDCFDSQALREKILFYHPKILAFTSKYAASQFYGRSKLEYGPQAESIADTRIWVLPSTSGNARPHWARLKHYWYQLGDCY
ncbi:mismatch-specific DNA-glycosylase [Candidatus Venteria ishoeyi]|uniref:G/U mismatch-specific DNA glycosylase n=1 Tax=Candidatus Venteria ishoeyi TaxID=1899563 RepID=A0A1H6F5B7_9GAMM|nr:mismatch-specific DNA-glycosylase [Candidatus Venteria ishoeyi]SEH04753.1 G/U mismatch-specific DNA glycosylase [Candidatus Venteria ishoeyi]